MRGLVIVAILGVAVSACGATKRQLRPDANVAVREGVVSVWATWVKDKDDKFDIGLNLRNEAQVPILIKLSEISGARGSAPGTLRHAFFGAGEREIDLAVGQTKSFTMVCHYQTEMRGDFHITIHRVYDNSTDEKSRGKVLAENVEWTQPDR